MDFTRRSGTTNRSTAGVLADIAHELSYTSDWEMRVQDALTMLMDIVPAHAAALGLQFDGWLTYVQPETDDFDEITERLLEHYTVMTGNAPNVAEQDTKSDWHAVEVISESDKFAGSCLSLPVMDASQVIGVLHVCIDQEDAYSPEDVSVLSIIALQIGSYIKNIQAQVVAQARAQEMETLKDEAEQRTGELESFISSTPDGVLFFDSECSTLMINDAGKRILGYPKKEPFANWANEMQIYSMDGQPVSMQETAPMKAIRGEITKDARYRLITGRGREIALGISASPVHDGVGKVVGVVSIFRDISEEMEYQRRRQELLEREQHIAQMLQQALIPPQVEYDIDGARIAVKYQPALKEAEIGGDFYDVFKLGDGRIGILIGDVAGKGLPAAVRVAAARYAVRSYAYLDSSPGVVMTLVNELLCRDDTDGAAFLTALYAVVDTANSSFTYACGGHEPPLVRVADGKIEELSQGGRALGVSCGYTYTEASRKLGIGETLVIVTDGITEARSGGVLFGIEGVVEFLQSHPKLAPSQTASELLLAATAHAGGALQDDAAIVVLEVARPQADEFELGLGAENHMI